MLVTHFLTPQSQTQMTTAVINSSRKSHRDVIESKDVYLLFISHLILQARKAKFYMNLTQILRIALVMLIRANKVNIVCRLLQVYKEKKESNEATMR